MKRTWFVQTDLFEASAPKRDFINERCFGEDFAAWFRARLEAKWVEDSKPTQEDWGRMLVVHASGHSFTISIGVMDEFIGKSPAAWCVSVEYDRWLNFPKFLWRQPNASQFDHVCNEVERVLKAEPRISFLNDA